MYLSLPFTLLATVAGKAKPLAGINDLQRARVTLVKYRFHKKNELLPPQAAGYQDVRMAGSGASSGELTHFRTEPLAERQRVQRHAGLIYQNVSDDTEMTSEQDDTGTGQCSQCFVRQADAARRKCQMLVLTRRANHGDQSVVFIGEQIVIQVISSEKGNVRLGITAPKTVHIDGGNEERDDRYSDSNRREMLGTTKQTKQSSTS